jgi:purine-binding chemotaxis protein CheW
VSELHVVFKVAGGEYVIAAADVLQMETFTGATRVPGSPAHVAGLVQIRGRVVPVVSLRDLFGLPAIDLTLDSRVLVVQDGERTVGLLVDSAREVVELDPGQLKPPPQLTQQRGTPFVKGVGQAGERLLMLIDCKQVLGEESLHAH